MTTATFTKRSPFVLRRIGRRDLSQVLLAAWQTRFSSWALPDFHTLLQSHEVLGWIAEDGKQVVGSLLCILIRKAEPTKHPWMEFLHRIRRRVLGQAPAPPASVHVLDLVVNPWWPQQQVEQALLERLAQKLYSLGRSVRIIVPETALPVQLFLRSAGCRATRILREHYSPEEDGYLMEWQESPPSAPPPAPSNLENAEVCGSMANPQSPG
jgi:ribosomal protein S18 acetylase RimI-like enzyme